MNGKRMDAFGEVTPKRLMNHAVALNPALPPEGVRHDIDPEMTLAAGPVPGMADVLVGFIDDLQAFGRESSRQLLRDDIADAHGAS
jgi:hypothetical protein